MLSIFVSSNYSFPNKSGEFKKASFLLKSSMKIFNLKNYMVLFSLESVSKFFQLLIDSNIAEKIIDENPWMIRLKERYIEAFKSIANFSRERILISLSNSCEFD